MPSAIRRYSDGGYAVADYRRVRSDLGTLDDLRALAATLRDNGISLVLDLVLNHVAREHEWAQRARAGDLRYRDYFHWFADRALPDAYERTLRDLRRRRQPLARSVPGLLARPGRPVGRQRAAVDWKRQRQRLWFRHANDHVDGSRS